MSRDDKSEKATTKFDSKKLMVKNPTSFDKNKSELEDEQLERIVGGAMSYHSV